MLSIDSSNNLYIYQLSWIHLISLFIHVLIYYTIQISNHSFIDRSVYPSTYPAIHLWFNSTYDLTLPTILPCVNPKFHPFAQTPIHPFNLNLAISLLIDTFHPLEILTERFIHLFIRLYVQAFIYLTKTWLIYPYSEQFNYI